MPTKRLRILMADDDPDDRELTREALEKNELIELYFVNDGVQLMDYLLRRNQFAPPESSPRPGIILLDVNMPKMSGVEALAEIQAHPDLHRIPVIVLTTSQAETDIVKSYALGAVSFITKPVAMDAFKTVVQQIEKYWFQTVELPPSA